MKQDKILGIIFIILMVITLFTSVACAVDEYRDRDLSVQQTSFSDSGYEKWEIKAKNGFICIDYNIGQKTDGTYIITFKFKD